MDGLTDMEDCKRGDAIVSTRPFKAIDGWEGDPVAFSHRTFLSLEEFTFDSIVTDNRGKYHHSKQVQFTSPDGYKGRGSILYFLPQATIERIVEKFWREGVEPVEEPELTLEGTGKGGSIVILGILAILAAAGLVSFIASAL